MSTLISTLNDFLATRKGRHDQPTEELLIFNHRITQEIMKASDQHRLLEYLGMRIPASKSTSEREQTKLPI